MAVKVERLPLQGTEFRSAGPNPLLKGFYPSNGKMFLSTVQTGTGASQNVAHGLGAVPAGVVIVPQDNTATAITEGAHDATNVKVTITAAAKFKVQAWL